MVKRAIAGLVLASLTVAPLTACGGGDAPEAGASTPAASGKARVKATKASVAWAGRVCDSLSDGHAKPRPPKIDPKDIAKSERAIAAYMTGMAKHLGEVRTTLRAAGPAPVPDGRSLLDGTDKDIQAVQRQLRDAASALHRTKVGTPEFRTAQGNAGKAMRRLGGYQPPTRPLRDSPALGDAFARATPCKKSGG